MPFIITTQRPDTRPSRVGHADDLRVISRVAVATLLDAKCAAFLALEDHSGVDFTDAVNDLPESGGSIGPFPDGTTITVGPVSGFTLASRALVMYEYHFGEMTNDEIVAAYNEKQANR